jgi:dienelactone hydrolase
MSLRLSAGLCSFALTALALAAEPVTREVAFIPSNLEAELPAPLRLDAATFNATEQPAADGLVLVTFPSPAPSGHAPNDTVHAELHLPPGDADTTRHPAVVFLHYLDGDLALPRIFCRTLAINGIAALLVKMPYYHERRIGTDRRMVSGVAEETAAAVRQAALDVRYARAYLAARPDVSPDRVGVAGISLGGIVGSLAFEIEPRLDRGCFLLAGADLATLLWDSRLTAKARTAWEQAGVTKADLVKAFTLVDPANYPGRRADRPVLLLAGRDDDVMPAACTAALVRALGDPEVIWFDGGHKPAPSDVADSLLRTAAFFAKRP